MKSFKFYSDSGHAWLAVKRKLLIELGIVNSFSIYSYENGRMVYLEEDCDAPKFINAYKAKYGLDSLNLVEVDHGGKSWIRSLSKLTV